MLAKQFLCWSGEALRAPEDSGSQNSRQLTHDGVKVFKPTFQPPLPPRKYSGYSFLLNVGVD